MVKGKDGSVCFDMLLCLMSCQDKRTGMGWEERTRKKGGGKGRGSGKELRRDLGKGYGGESKKKLS